MKKMVHGKQGKIMRNKLVRYIGVLFLFVVGMSELAYSAEEDLCHVFLIQVPDKTPNEGSEFDEQELTLAIELAKQFANADIAAIYTSDEPCAIQMAALMAEYHDVPVIEHATLQALLPNTLFQRVGDLRTFGIDLVEQNRGKKIVLITHESLVRFISRYVKGGVKKVPNFSYIEITSDGKSMYLSVLKMLFG